MTRLLQLICGGDVFDPNNDIIVDLTLSLKT